MVQTTPVAGFATTGLALRASLVGLVVLVPLAAPDASAQGFPTRPVRIIDAFPAGGAGDVIARILSPRLGEAIGQTVIVENRPGAGGNIGAEVAAKAPADGHTMFMGVSVVLAPSRSLYANLPYDALRDFMPVSRVGTGAYLLASHPSLPVKSVKDVVALARAKPGALNYASGGIGSGQHLAGELFKSRTGSALTHVAYKGGPPAVAAVAAGESEIGFVTVTAGLGQVNAGRLRALGVSSPQRLPTMPNVPTIAESGYPGFEVTPIFGLYVPTGTPKEVIAALNAAVRKTVDNAEVRDRLAAQAVVAGSSTPEELGRSLAEEIAQWTKVIKAAGIRIE
ncbi:MAG: tripartite tricarboxylate transporter substrate binding protein [Proteobacteria bacterium]|jgi:tripartite-type tricarboxylate transporter receptor subunit TctC|nr:tripartite tricarboxylate transporter substrate binding protein [Pseudomonadota bacterium]